MAKESAVRAVSPEDGSSTIVGVLQLDTGRKGLAPN
jgi:hypothetical protein